MRCLLTLAAAMALVAAAGACGSIIQIPDQGVVVLGCRAPAYCYVAGSCSCTRKDATPGGSCTVPIVQVNPLDPSTWVCPANAVCLETVQACVGRGPVCDGVGARCLPAGASCRSSGGDPPQMVGYSDGGATLEPRCAFTDDVCCPGLEDGGTSD